MWGGNMAMTMASLSHVDEMQLCRSYLHMLKASKGTLRPDSTLFWASVASHLQIARRLRDALPVDALKTVWQAIETDVCVFSGCIDTIRSHSAGDLTTDQELHLALELYQANHPQHKRFGFLHCWQILSNQAEWQPKAATKAFPSVQVAREKDARPLDDVKKHEPSKASESETSGCDGNPLKRIADAMDRIADAAVKRARIAEEANEMKLFSTPLSTLDEDGKAFYRLKRTVVWKRIKAEEQTWPKT
ncbi:hypothetical protein Poli38472_008776 [Pythium oligandrum]|uniref:No apical meristem-associated C-terminal domain-containing protein n=1 Tax=Pythium oligandrum TaxID=41045 RepID=A0A8K1FES4_PYTOL|nr:hypothetical protein Poli38472_008776 [Pythium oligandrum]|eukprot:TMW56128.1 hypothetical protein Poli38472_008776 [Pythium oligandrum]